MYRLFFVRKMIFCLIIVFLLCNISFASNQIPPMSNIINNTKKEIISPYISPADSENRYENYSAPIFNNRNNKFNYNGNYYDYNGNYNGGINYSDATSDYIREINILIEYYKNEIAKYKSLSGYHEENYIYQTGERGVSVYNGVLSMAIEDFNNDTLPEMALFKMNTQSVDEFSNKEITLEIIKVFNGLATISDKMVLSAEQYLGEEIECDISIKKINDNYRIYLNYFENRVREKHFENKYIAVEYPYENLTTICTVDLSGDEDTYENSFEFQDNIIDSGINILDDNNIYKRAFLNDDANVIPIFTIKRVNEKINNDYTDDYFEREAVLGNEVIKLRYGYTNFINRSIY